MLTAVLLLTNAAQFEGCLLFEMMALRVPFNGKDLRSLAAEILKRRTPSLPRAHKKNVELGDLVNKLLSKHADDRPTTTEVLETPYLSSQVSFWSVTHAPRTTHRTPLPKATVLAIRRNFVQSIRPSPPFLVERSWCRALSSSRAMRTCADYSFHRMRRVRPCRALKARGCQREGTASNTRFSTA